MSFYEFEQNDIDGDFVVNDKVCHTVFIEAKSPNIANTIAEYELGIYFDGVEKGLDCGCCGDRWRRVDEYNKEEFPLEYTKEISFDNIETYAKFLANKYGLTTPDIRIYFNDGSIKEFYTEK